MSESEENKLIKEIHKMATLKHEPDGGWHMRVVVGPATPGIDHAWVGLQTVRKQDGDPAGRIAVEYPPGGGKTKTTEVDPLTELADVCRWHAVVYLGDGKWADAIAYGDTPLDALKALHKRYFDFHQNIDARRSRIMK